MTALPIDNELRLALNSLDRVPEKGETLTTISGAQFQIVDRNVQTDYDDDSWEENGATRAWVILNIGGVLYRKEGYSDSWSDWEWDGPATVVQAEQEVVTKYKAIAFTGFDAAQFARNVEHQEFGYLPVGGTMVTAYGVATLVSRWGDADGNGEQVSRVFEIGGDLYRWDGWYSSWEGVAFTGKPYPVEGREETVIRYHRV